MNECLIRTEFNENGILTTIKRYTNINGCNYSVYETGIRVGEEFNLVQHGWGNYTKAHELISKMVNKGWDSFRITEVLEFIEEKKFCLVKPKLLA